MANTFSSTAVEVVRLRFDSERSFDAVKAALIAQMGRITGAEIAQAVTSASSAEAFERNVNGFAGAGGFILFFEVDHSRYLPFYGVNRRAVRLIFGNPSVAATMTRHDVTAGLFAPVGLLLFEAGEGSGASVIYDLPSSLMQAQKNPSLLAAALALDAKMLALVAEATGVDPLSAGCGA